MFSAKLGVQYKRLYSMSTVSHLHVNLDFAVYGIVVPNDGVVISSQPNDEIDRQLQLDLPKQP